MAKPALDSDLYGGDDDTLDLSFLFVDPILLDIYGDDDNDYAVPLQDKEEVRESPPKENQELSDTSPSSNIETESLKQPTTRSKDAFRPLPAKPLSPNSGSLSYSAQIAQQFSAYQQTPSQERQQRTEIHSSKRSSTLIANEGSSSASSHNTVFGKKPSEMHDAG